MKLPRSSATVRSRASRPCWVLWAVLAAGCETTESRRPLPADPGEIVRAAPTRAWEIREGELLLGHLVAFESGERTMYMVRNPWHQDIGLIDEFGRAYRYLPHHREPAWVGTGTVAQGVAEILEAGEECQLVETALPSAALEAAAPAEG